MQTTKAQIARIAAAFTAAPALAEQSGRLADRRRYTARRLTSAGAVTFRAHHRLEVEVAGEDRIFSCALPAGGGQRRFRAGFAREGSWTHATPEGPLGRQSALCGARVDPQDWDYEVARPDNCRRCERIVNRHLGVVP